MQTPDNLTDEEFERFLSAAMSARGGGYAGGVDASRVLPPPPVPSDAAKPPRVVPDPPATPSWRLPLAAAVAVFAAGWLLGRR